MTKKQKIWFAVFLSMFILPEVLWSPLLNFYYELSKTGDVYPVRVNFITNDFIIWKIVLWIQLISLAGAIVIMVLIPTKRIIKLPIIAILTGLMLLVILAVLFNFSVG